jgi:integrase
MSSDAQSAPWLQMQEGLTGMWAQDQWCFELKHDPPVRRLLSFSLLSSTLKVELKYALWYKFATREWGPRRKEDPRWTRLNTIIHWLAHCTPAVASLQERSLADWEGSLQSYLVQAGRYRPERRKRLHAPEEAAVYFTEDVTLGVFRQLYLTVAAAYDGSLLSPEEAIRQREASGNTPTRGLRASEDVWDLREMGLALNLTAPDFHMNFGKIPQPWLREVTKQYMQYALAVRSPASCLKSLHALARFARFLAERYPTCRLSDIDRALMVQYIGALREAQISASSQRVELGCVRSFLETCAYHLQIEGLSRERLIFPDDLARVPKTAPRDIPEEVLEQLRAHLSTLPTTLLRMVVILLECGMRISELCSLPLDCLLCDDRHEWYLRTYQLKMKQEHVIPLVDPQVIAVIQAQQAEVRARWAESCPYLFPNPRSPQLPARQDLFRTHLNRWARQQRIRDRDGKPYHFQAHQFRHTVGMRLLNNNVPLEVISRLLGHHSLAMTQVYARVKAQTLRAELERVQHHRKTVNALGQAVKGDARANDPDAQLTRKGIRGQTLPVGGCGRLVVRGPCDHANKCLTCPMWLTSTDDLPALKAFYTRAVRLKQRAEAVGNQLVLQQQDHLIPLLAVRITSLETPEMDGTLAVDDLLLQLRADLAAAQAALEEVREAGLILASRPLEWTMTELTARIAALEGAV